jgi:CheY-like chemotaxis protein
VDVMLLDLKLPDADGVDILATVRKEHPELQTIIVTGFANVQSAIDTMRLGAFDYLTKPPNFEELGMRVEKAGEKTLLERENRRLRFQVQRNLSSDILTRSPVLQKVLRTIEMVAAARTPVLIEGESGVGKELLAQHVHRLSPRAAKAFVDLNCAAVPSSLLESELFGYERGAFTGAANEKPGLVEVADGGTLFLDEVGEMIPEIQSKFLRVLDSGTFYRVGATRKRRADFRLVCATNRDLKNEVTEGRFRKDLFFRVNGVKVVIPPLRERPEDIPLLVDHFSKQLPPKRCPAALALSDYVGGQRPRAALRGGARGAAAEGDMIDLGDLPGIVERTGRGPVSVASAPPAAPMARRRRSTRRLLEGPGHAGQAALEKAKWRREGGGDPGGRRELYRWIKLGSNGPRPGRLRAEEAGQVALSQDGEPDDGLEKLVREESRPHAQVDAGDAAREPAREIHTSPLHEEVHDREVVALPLGRGHRCPGRAHEAHPVAAAADEARERLAAPGV